jgi:hypothetical protein
MRHGQKKPAQVLFLCFKFVHPPKEMTVVESVLFILDHLRYNQLRIEARDMGIPTYLSSDLDLSVYVKNVDDMKPKFSPNKQTLNFTGKYITYSSTQYPYAKSLCSGPL